MSNEKKTIRINPELFKVAPNRTRKKRSSSSDEEGGDPHKLRVRAGRPRHNRTTKNQILKYIRQQQEQRYNKLLEQNGGRTRVDTQTPSNLSGGGSNNTKDFESDFQQSLDFLNQIAEKNKNSLNHKWNGGGQTTPSHNHTLKQYPSYDPGRTQSVLYNNSVLNPLLGGDISVEAPNDLSVSSMKLTAPSHPQYGCLKGGNLPTYRMWKRQTEKNYPSFTRTPLHSGGVPHYPQYPTPHTTITPPSHTITPANSFVTPPNSGGVNNTTVLMEPTQQNGGEVWDGGQKEEKERRQKILEKLKNPEWLKRGYETQSYMKKKEEIKHRQQAPQFKKRKQKKTLRRTYRVGKSKYYPRVSVLVSNRTLRKQITEKCQKLKQIPIEEVRKTLIKKGFIKVGSIAPADVLRKMYETVSTVCGDVHNHNSDNMIYNYFNGKE